MVFVTVATGGSWGWVSALGVPGSVSSALSASNVVGGVVSILGGGALANSIVDGLFMACGLCVAAALVSRARIEGLVLLGAALTAVALTGPAVHPWYLLWGIPFLAIGASERRANAIAVLSIVPLFLVAPGGSGFQTALTGVDPAVLLGAPVAFAAAMVFSRAVREAVRTLPIRLTSTWHLAVDSLGWVALRVRLATSNADTAEVGAVP
jgi:alpha-1,6-mannosyltransferase